MTDKRAADLARLVLGATTDGELVAAARALAKRVLAAPVTPPPAVPWSPPPKPPKPAPTPKPRRPKPPPPPAPRRPPYIAFQEPPLQRDFWLWLQIRMMEHGGLEGAIWQRFGAHRHALLERQVAADVPSLIDADDYRIAMETCTRFGINVPERFL